MAENHFGGKNALSLCGGDTSTERTHPVGGAPPCGAGQFLFQPKNGDIKGRKNKKFLKKNKMTNKMTKKSIRNIIFLVVFLAAGFGFLNFVFGQTCPQNTEAGENQATLVGEITDAGGDSNLESWLQYGKSQDYGYETPHQPKSGTGLFCYTIYNLESCTLYHYRAAAKNSAGTSYGVDKTFTTKCLTVSADLKANNSDSSITLNYRDYVSLSWTSENAVSCEASGDWSGSKSTSGLETIQLNTVKTYNFTITCKNASGVQTKNDSVQVVVRPILPTVITKPAVVTY